MPLKALAREIFLITGAAVAAALIVNFFSPNGIRLAAEPGFPKCQEAPATVIPEVPLSYGPEAFSKVREIFQAHSALFVDARGPQFFKNGHIPGAVSLPLGQFDEALADFMKKFDVDTRIITYCYSSDCPEGEQLARRLRESGYGNVSLFRDGLVAWEREGLPVE